MTCLEALQRTIDIGIERAGNTGFTRQVARDHQTLAQRLNGWITDADLKLLLACRNVWPTAIRNDLLILQHGLLHIGW